MKQAREVATCTRCRLSKRKCDQAKPNCTRCMRGGVQCTYEDQQLRENHPSISNEPETHTSTPATTPPTPVQLEKVRKRNRACLSCTRCHRLKVKCNQKEPCGRCIRSGVQATCVYTHKKTSAQSSAATESPSQSCVEIPFALTGEDPEFVVATWYLRKRGSTHYRAILDRVSTSAVIVDLSVAPTVRSNTSRVARRH